MPRPLQDPSRRQGILDRLDARLAVAALTLLLLGDVIRVGFFADDFLFLDAARRQPWLDVLLGQHGIAPWYRPLARELYFALALAVEPWSRLLTVFLSVATAGAAAVGLVIIARRLGSTFVGVAAATLFLAHELTKFLTAWASGYQDLLSAALTVGTVAAALSGRPWTGLALAGLAPFAKETGVIAFPLYLLARRIGPNGRHDRGEWTACGATMVLVGLLHGWVRLNWRGAGSVLEVASDPVAAARACVEAVARFCPAPAAPTAAGLIVAAGAVLVVVHALRRSDPRSPTPESGGGRTRLLGLAVAGAALGLAPLVVGNLLALSVVKTYYAFPAIPWIALVLALGLERLGRPLGIGLIAMIVAWSASNLSYREPPLDTPRAWISHPPGWTEATRLSAAARRFQEDLRGMRGHIPRRSTILYSGIPTGAYLVQGDDGAATRELLADTTLRAGYLGRFVDPGATGSRVLIRFDPATLRLVRRPPESDELLIDAAERLVAGDLATSRVLLRSALPGNPRASALRRYLSGAERALRSGFAPDVPGEGGEWPDSASAETGAFAQAIAPEPRFASIYEAMLRNPHSVGGYDAAIDTFLVLERPLQAALTLRLRIALPGSSDRHRIILGQLLEIQNMRPAAAGMYDEVLRSSSDAEARAIAGELRARLQALESGATNSDL